MRVQAALQGNLEGYMRAELDASRTAVTRAMRRASDGLKRDWRGQILEAGLGQRVANTIRSRVYPQGRTSRGAAGLVYSKASHIVGAFDRGVTIRSKAGFFLAIPTKDAGRGPNNRKITPGLWEQRHGIRLTFIYRRGGPSLLVATLRARRGQRGGFAAPSATALRTGRGLATVPIFILLPQTTLSKRLDLDRDVAKWQALLADLVLQEWPEVTPERRRA